MIKPLRICVADDEPDMRDYLVKILPRLGHQVVGAAQTGRELLERVLHEKPDLMITDIRMPEMDGIEAAAKIYEQIPVPVVLISAHDDPELIERAERDHILAYLVKPIKQADLEQAITIALRRFEQFQELQCQAADLRQALDDRKVVERAKGILMKQSGLDEQGAFQRLQSLATDKDLTLVLVAENILRAAG
jgi:response regulator NasT